MTRRLRVRFDGKVLVPEGAVDLPTDRPFDVVVEDSSKTEVRLNGPPRSEGQVQDGPTLADIARWADTLPVVDELPTDLAAQVDHYLYGTPKRP